MIWRVLVVDYLVGIGCQVGLDDLVAIGCGQLVGIGHLMAIGWQWSLDWCWLSRPDPLILFLMLSNSEFSLVILSLALVNSTSCFSPKISILASIH